MEVAPPLSIASTTMKTKAMIPKITRSVLEAAAADFAARGPERRFLWIGSLGRTLQPPFDS